LYDQLVWPRRQVEDRSKNITQDVIPAARTISVPGCVVITVLITTLESLLEIILILIASYVRSVTITSLRIDTIAIVVVAASISAVHLTLAIALLVTAVDGLP
jgi:hypothetical protein